MIDSCTRPSRKSDAALLGQLHLLSTALSKAIQLTPAWCANAKLCGAAIADGLTFQTRVAKTLDNVSVYWRSGKNADGSVQVVRTPHGPTVLVISSKPVAGTTRDCETHTKALIVKNQTVALSTKGKASAFADRRTF